MEGGGDLIRCLSEQVRLTPLTVLLTLQDFVVTRIVFVMCLKGKFVNVFFGEGVAQFNI